MNRKHHVSMSLIDMEIHNQRSQKILSHPNKVIIKEQKTPRNSRHLQNVIAQNAAKSRNEKSCGTIAIT